MEDRETLELLNEALNELEILLVRASGQDALKHRIESFIACDELFREYVKEFYFRHYSDREVPEDEIVSTVFYELVIDQLMTQDQAADLFDQFMAAALLATPGWFESQPVANFEDILSKIPSSYRAMCSALRIMKKKDREEG
jgi:hypothetical protein